MSLPRRRLLQLAALLALPLAYGLAGVMLLAMVRRPLHEWRWSTYYRYAVADSVALQRPLLQSALLAGGVTLLPLLGLARWQPQRSLFGEARFADDTDIRKAGLLGREGIVVGHYNGRYLLYPGSQHVLMCAPTRSGKGVGVVIPNLLNWPDSAVVLDIKQENYDLTAGFRADHGQATYLFNPAAADYRTHCYNPLDYVAEEPAFRVDDLQKIAYMLYPDLPGVDPIWNASCRSLFLGTALYLKETPELPCTIGEILRQHLTAEDTAARLQSIINSRGLLRPGEVPSTRRTAGSPLSQECVTALNDFISVKSENTRSSIKKTFTSRLELWLNPLIDAATSRSDFDLRELRRQRLTIYVGVTPDNLERLQPLLNLFFQQLIDLNTRVVPDKDPAYRHRVLLVLDEFAAIGRMGVLAKSIGYVAGYGLRLLPIIQTMSQLNEVYGRDAAQTFVKNHELKIVFTPNDIHDAEELSRSFGDTTVTATSVSRATHWFRPRDHRNESQSPHRRALLLPQEIMDLPNDRAVLMLRATPPILCQKIRYYAEPAFQQRLFHAPHVARLNLARPPSLLAKATVAAERHEPCVVESPASAPGGSWPERGGASSSMTQAFSADALHLDLRDIPIPENPDALDEASRRELHARIYQALTREP